MHHRSCAMSVFHSVGFALFDCTELTFQPVFCFPATPYTSVVLYQRRRRQMSLTALVSRVRGRTTAPRVPSSDILVVLYSGKVSSI